MEDFKKKKRIKVFFTMDEDIDKKFNDYIEKENINKSKLIQYLIENYLNDIKKEK
jgi:metal-responsive CopG/Arc/MetJ family transcriptional regulator